MKAKQSILKLIWAITILALCISVASATEIQPIQWNEAVQSQILNNNELIKLGKAFPAWQIKQITWPSVSEISSKKVAVDPNLTASCMAWLTKFIKANQLPLDLDKHLIAMKDWGLICEESEQKHLCDVFIVGYRKGESVVHIQESPYNVVITVADERLVNDTGSNHKNMIIETAMSILSEQLKPDVNSDFHLFELEDIKISRAVWLTRGVATTDKDGKKCANLTNASKNGATSVEAETDGRFVKFDITKEVEGPRASPDPYEKRFE